MNWVLIAQLGIIVGVAAYHRYLAGPPPDTASKHLLSRPVVNEGMPLAMVIGRQRVRQPLFLWYGGFTHRNYLGQPFYPRPTGAPPNYGMNMLLNVGVPMGDPTTSGSVNAKLISMWAGDKQFTFNTPLLHGDMLRTAPVPGMLGGGGGTENPFGTIDVDGGAWVGLISFYAGGTDQLLSNNDPFAGITSVAVGGDPTFIYADDITPIAIFMRVNADPALQALIIAGGGTVPSTSPISIDPTEIPGYRNQMLVSFTGDVTWDTMEGGGVGYTIYEAFFFGSNPAIPQFSFEVATYRVQYDAGWAGNDDCDPASAIYEILTSKWAGIGLAPGLIDAVSLGAASTTLLAEGIGYSRVFDQLTDGKTMLQEIVNHVGGALYMDSTDGLVHLKLIRGDYVVADLPAFGVSDLLQDGVIQYTPGSWRPVVNQVRVKYYERALDYNEESAVAHNMASSVMQATDFGTVSAPAGNLRSTIVEYPGCTTRALANKLAARDLNVLGQPLDAAQFGFTRAARGLRPGDAFTMTIPDLYMDQRVFRVIGVNLGQLGDGKVIVDCMQDAFAQGEALAFPSPL